MGGFFFMGFDSRAHKRTLTRAHKRTLTRSKR